MHIVVFGTGGVGGYFGGRLAQAGEHVTFIARGDHLQAMLANGLTVESINGDFTVMPVVATDDISRVEDADIVLVCVKTWHISQAAQSIKLVLGQNTIVVPLENGVEAPSLLSEALGEEHVLGGLCRIASRITSPGHIHHTGIEPYIAFGELDNRPSSRSQDLLSVFNAGVKAEIPDDITSLGKNFSLSQQSVGSGSNLVPWGLPVSCSTRLARCLKMCSMNVTHWPSLRVSDYQRIVLPIPSLI
jgi:2-dehydropantoate 2-reductase